MNPTIRQSTILLLLLVIQQHLSIHVTALHTYGSSSPSISSSSASTTLSSSIGSIRTNSFLGKPNSNYCLYRTSSSSYGILNNRSRNRNCNFLIMMAKGDGKKRRPKQAASLSPASSPASSASPKASPAPARVSNDINVPIRQQIRYGKLNKQYRQNAGQTSFRQTKKVTRTKYRRTWDEEDIIQKAEERKRKGQDPDWDVILNRTAAEPLVLVDGYNIIHAWPRLKKHMNKGDPNRARQLLLDDLENLRSIKGWRIEVVYDGAARNNRRGPLGDTRQSISEADRAPNKDVSKYGVREVFTGSGVEADSYIEAKCSAAKNVTGGEYTGSFVVATDDTMIRLAGENAGAMCMSSDRFVSELKSVKKAVAYRVEAAMAKVNGEAMRPEKLWGTNTFAPRGGGGGGGSTTSTSTAKQQNKQNGKDGGGAASSNKDERKQEKSSLPTSLIANGSVETTADGKTVYTSRFGRRTLLIEDKRKKNKKKKPNK